MDESSGKTRSTWACGRVFTGGPGAANLPLELQSVPAGGPLMTIIRDTADADRFVIGVRGRTRET